MRVLRSCVLVIVALALVAPGRDLFARGGGQRWGYQPPAGSPLGNLWRVASPWAAMEGLGIPHHSLDAPRLGSGSGPQGSFNSNRQFPTIDRSVEFPGASSNTSVVLPSFEHTAPTQPYSTDKKYDPPYFHNYDGYWHHGYWGGGQWGWGRWGGEAGIWSVARWWLGPLYFTSGYGTYRNPFAIEQKSGGPPYLNYGRPLENLDDDPEPSTSAAAAEQADKATPSKGTETYEEIQNYLLKSPEAKAGLKSFDAADEAFQAGQYKQALAHMDAALVQLPYDPALHEFRGLVLFALEDYQQSAATIYAVLSISPGWDWTTLSSRYADRDVFTRQLRKLEAYNKQHPESAAAAFLRAYHYTTCRHTEAAVKQFENVVKLLPDDRFVPQLTSLVAGGLEKSVPDSAVSTQTSAATDGAVPEPTTDDSSLREARPVTIATLLGDWKAQPRESTTIQLRLRKNQQFVWTAMQENSPRVIAGRFAVEGNMLFLAGGSGTLVGSIEFQADGSFQFSLLGNSQSDRGLVFRSTAAR